MEIRINFTPDMDVDNNVDNPVVDLCSFGENPETVSEKGAAYARGLENTDTLSTPKHFPEHGDTSEDPHETLLVMRHNRIRLDSVELLPFKRYIYDGFGGMMTGHLYIPALDKGHKPASFSKAVVTNLLQKELGLQGLCFTNASATKGASTKKTDSPSVKALLAGNDILLAPAAPISDFTAVKRAIEEGVLDLEAVEAKCLKILRYKYIIGLDAYKPVEAKGLSKRLNSPHAVWMATKLNSGAIAVLKNEDTILPLKRLNKKKIAALSIEGGVGNEFQKILGEYDPIVCFSTGRRSTATQVQQVYDKLQKYDVIIYGVHTTRIPKSLTLRQLATKRKLVYTFFTLPHAHKEYKKSIEKAKAVVLAYESIPLAQEYAAQMVFGGIAAGGKLPVSIPGLYYAGTGIFTEKTCLGYHQPEGVGADPDRLDVTGSIVKKRLDERAYSGCQVLIAKGGIVIYNGSSGYFDYEDRQPVTEASVYDLVSASRAAGTLLAVMRAYDEKELTLNNRVPDFIPELKESNKKGSSVKELLYHQPGVTPTTNFCLDAIDKDSYKDSLCSSAKSATHPARFDARTYVRNNFRYLPDIVLDTWKPGFTTEVVRNFYVSDSFKDMILQDTKKSRLGTRGRYVCSCVNFVMLKMMVENLMKSPMDQLLQNDFYSELEAWHTTYNLLKRADTLQIVSTEQDRFVRHRLLRGYVHDETATFQGGVSGDAGLFSNTNDLAEVLQLMLNQGTYGGEHYLSLETNRLFTQGKSPACHRGLGFDRPVIGNPEASPCGALAPASTYGHTGFTDTYFWVDPDNRLIYIFLSNRVGPSQANNKLGSLDIRTRIQDTIYETIDRKNQKDS